MTGHQSQRIKLCRGGRGGGEDAVGVRRAFHVAGARCVERERKGGGEKGKAGEGKTENESGRKGEGEGSERE